MLQKLTESLGARPPSPFFNRDLGGRDPEKRYLIATTGRSGSTFLCRRIADHGVLGFPMEFLNESYIAEFDRLFPNPNLDDYRHYVTRAFTSPARVFGVKSDWWRFQIAQKQGLAEGLVGEIDLIIHLRRRDFVAQAISLALAVETGAWHNRDVGVEGADCREPAYDSDKIKGHARNILNQEFHWRRFMDSTDVRHMNFDYEDIARDVDGAIARIADALDVEIGEAPPSATVRKARSESALAWRWRFEEECADFIAFWREYRGLISAE